MSKTILLPLLSLLFSIGFSVHADVPADPCVQYLKTRGVEKATLEVTAPIIVRAVDRFLRGPGLDQNSKLVFMARDGKAGYQAAKVLLALHPERYPNVKRSQISFLHINRAVIWSSYDLIPEYLKQSGITPNSTVYFFDVGWIGSMTRQLNALVDEVGAKFGGLFLIYALNEEPGERLPQASSYLQLNWREPFHTIHKNPVLHFLRDTYSGPHLQIYELHKEGDVVQPVLRGDYIWQDREVREMAIKAVIKYAERLESADLDDPEKAKQDTDRLIEFMSEPENFIKLMVPQDKH